jgi:hypothetical protein
MPDESVTYTFTVETGEVSRDNGTGDVVILRGVTNMVFTLPDANGDVLGNTPLNALDRFSVRYVDLFITGTTDSGEPVEYTSRVALRNGIDVRRKRNAKPEELRGIRNPGEGRLRPGHHPAAGPGAGRAGPGCGVDRQRGEEDILRRAGPRDLGLRRDAGGEVGINFIRVADNPPSIINMADNTVDSSGETVLQGSQTYQYNCQYQQRRVKPGWGVEYLDYDYSIQSRGEASTKGQSNIQVVVSRLFKEGY